MVLKVEARSPPFANAGSSVSRSHRRFSVSAAVRTSTIISSGLTLKPSNAPKEARGAMSEGQKPFWDRRGVARAAAAASIIIVLSAAVAKRTTGLSATYFTDDRWEHAAYTVIDRQVSTDALTGNAPVSPDQPFSVRWFGYFNAVRNGTYAFAITASGDAGMSIDQPGPAGGRVFAVVTDAVDLGS